MDKLNFKSYTLDKVLHYYLFQELGMKYSFKKY